MEIHTQTDGQSRYCTYVGLLLALDANSFLHNSLERLLNRRPHQHPLGLCHAILLGVGEGGFVKRGSRGEHGHGHEQGQRDEATDHGDLGCVVGIGGFIEEKCGTFIGPLVHHGSSLNFDEIKKSTTAGPSEAGQAIQDRAHTRLGICTRFRSKAARQGHMTLHQIASTHPFRPHRSTHTGEPMPSCSSTISRTQPRKRTCRAAATAASVPPLLLQLLLVATTRTSTAYQPADGPGQECRLFLSDETAFSLPPGLSGGGELPAVMLVGDQDLRPLFTDGTKLGEGLTLRLDAWIPAAATAAGCVPNALGLTAGAGGLRVPLPQPSIGWKAGQWSMIEASVTPEAFMGQPDWEDLDQLVVLFACDAAGDGNWGLEDEMKMEQREAETIKVCVEVLYNSLTTNRKIP